MSTNKKKTVLFLPAWYPTRNDNMGGIFVRAFGLALKKQLNVDVLHVAADKNMNKLFEYTIDSDSGLNTHIIYYKKPKTKNVITVILEGALYAIAVFMGYYKYRKINKRPHIFHVFVLTRAGILPFILSFFRKTNYYVTEVWSRYMPEDGTFNGAFRKWLARRVATKAKGISTVSYSLKNALLSHGINSTNFQIIHSVVPKNFFETKLFNRNGDIVRFLHVSCFDDYIKNISGMLNAFKLVEDEGLPFELQLVGNGADFELMQTHAKNIGLKNVFFQGKLVGWNLFEAFEMANSLVLFSNFETQGCVILEAHACGMPVIGSATGGITELISRENGLLVEPGNERELADAIKNMIINIDSYNSKAIRNHAVANYSYEHIADKFISFYRDGGANI